MGKCCCTKRGGRVGGGSRTVAVAEFKTLDTGKGKNAKINLAWAHPAVVVALFYEKLVATRSSSCTKCEMDITPLFQNRRRRRLQTCGLAEEREASAASVALRPGAWMDGRGTTKPRQKAAQHVRPVLAQHP